jgi:UDP-N-acetylmuramoylalanine--D-glutamate ligase
MTKPYEFAGRNVTVLGLGPTGLSLARYASKRGARVNVRDTRAEPPSLNALRESLPAVRFCSGAVDADSTRDADMVLMSPGVSIFEPGVSAAKARGVIVAGDIELFGRHIPNATQTIGITGSNGKTTTTALTGHLCSQAGKRTLVAGNIGNNVLDELEVIERNGVWPEVVVLELSSFQLEATSSLRCASATVLNISDDHLDRYPSLHEYAHTKANLLGQTALQVLNRDDILVRGMKRTDRAAVSFGADEPESGHYGLREGSLACGNDLIASSDTLRIHGRHNAMNALAALALVSPLQLSASALAQALGSFEGLPHRMALVATVEGVDYIDDSKATNVGAVVAALDGLGRKAILIVGGDGKGQDFSPLASPVREHARAVILIGADGKKIFDAIKSSGVPIMFCDTLEAAVPAAQKQAFSGDSVLLSPACASFDMFRNYGHRSAVFVDAVKGLISA